MLIPCGIAQLGQATHQRKEGCRLAGSRLSKETQGASVGKRACLDQVTRRRSEEVEAGEHALIIEQDLPVDGRSETLNLQREPSRHDLSMILVVIRIVNRKRCRASPQMGLTARRITSVQL
jgi:hypothetical protein